MTLRRDDMLQRATSHDRFDLIVIGGGATGMGIAVDAAARKYSVLLLERADFASGTSSRSTKLIHGGVRYLRQGNLSLVKEGLRERGLLRKNAPHLVTPIPFIIPVYSSFEKLFYALGMKAYDLLAGRLTLGRSQILSKKETLAKIPTLNEKNLAGGILYFDGQFDDARLLIDLAHTAASQGAILLNYAPVTRLQKNSVEFLNLETQHSHTVKAHCIINATGPFSDKIRHLDNPTAPPLIAPSQGIHLVLPQKFLPGNAALMIPKTPDGRVIFAIPWRNHTLLGTTDTLIETAPTEPAQPDEITFLLTTAAKYLTHPPTRADVLSVFAGIRPLVKQPGKTTKRTARDHLIEVSPSGLLTIVGGKWTTYRQMAEDVVNRAITVGGLDPRPCTTRTLKIDNPAPTQIQQLIAENPTLNQSLHARYQITAAEVIHAVRHEMARNLDDVLARRTRILFLDAHAALDLAAPVAHLMAQELHQNETWIQTQLEQFRQLAGNYLLTSA